jgi:hypothetical protein
MRSRSPMVKRTVRRKRNCMVALEMTEKTMERGTRRRACLTSSDMWMMPSKPGVLVVSLCHVHLRGTPLTSEWEGDGEKSKAPGYGGILPSTNTVGQGLENILRRAFLRSDG